MLADMKRKYWQMAGLRLRAIKACLLSLNILSASPKMAQKFSRMDDEFAAKFADSVERITGLLSERVKEEMPMTAAIRDDWPPCFESAVSELNQGVNVNHVGRVFLAAFSRSIGLQQEQACNFFSNAPDYDADTTSYQVGQIYEREYTPHGCSSLKTHGRCPVQI